MTFHRIYLPLADAAPRICDGDLLQFRPRGWRLAEHLTAIAGRGEYCHSALAAWWKSEVGNRKSVGKPLAPTSDFRPPTSTLMLIEARLQGIRAVTLRSQVERYPGLIDVYETNRGSVFPAFHAAAMVAAMREKTGRTYGWRLLLRSALSHTLLMRLIVRACTQDNGSHTDHRGPEFCSQAIASAARLAGGEDPVSALCDGSTEPSDLTRSALFNHNGQGYRFTLVP
jgi:hypothetical protein